jgi:hypothetical protein
MLQSGEIHVDQLEAQREVGRIRVLHEQIQAPRQEGDVDPDGHTKQGLQ